MPSRIHAICNPVLLFHVAIHSPATPVPPVPFVPPPLPSPILYPPTSPSFDQSANRESHAGTLIADCAVGFMLHFLFPIKMQLRLFDTARVVPIVPLSRPYIPIPFIPTGWKCSGHYLRGKIAYREMSTSFSFSRCKSRLIATR